MKTFRLAGVIAFVIILLANFFACSSDPIVPEVTVEMGKEDYFAKNMDFDSSAGEKTFSFNSNVEWTISVAPTMNGETWCTVTPSSGKDGSNTVVVKVQENTGYDDRNVVLTLTAGSTLTKTITVTQKQKDALLLTTNKFEMEPQGGKINVEVKANVEYEVIVPEAYKSWISQGSKSRGLTTSTVSFDIAETEEYDKREGEIIFKSGNLSETVRVYQTGRAILLLSKNECLSTSREKNIIVEIKSNFNFATQMPNVDWLKENKSRGVSSHTLYFTIDSNTTNENRSTSILFYDKNSDLKETLYIKQYRKGYYEVKLDNAGSLSTYMTDDDKYEIEELVVSGELNGDDICLIRDMVGLDYEGNKSNGILKIIDMSKAKIIKGGNAYPDLWGRPNCYTEDNVLSEYMFANATNIVKFSLPNSITRIDRGALVGCSGLTQIIVPKEVKTISSSAFGDCSSLTEIILPANLEIIEDGAFDGCLSLSDITLPENLITLGGAFSGCRKLSKITIPNKVTTIGFQGFWNCMSLKEIIIGNSVEKYENRAFFYSGIEKIIFPGSAKELSEEICASCYSLREVIINEGVEIIHSKAFRGCSNLVELTLPSTLTQIRANAFTQVPNAIYCKATTPPTLYVENFMNGNKDNCTIYVPKGSVSAYKAADVWRKFSNIKEIE